MNEKIEGFYKVASKISRASEHIVMIPVQNTKHLMLDLDTRNAVKTGILKVVPVKYIWEAFEVATGVALGSRIRMLVKTYKDSCRSYSQASSTADYRTIMMTKMITGELVMSSRSTFENSLMINPISSSILPSLSRLLEPKCIWITLNRNGSIFTIIRTECFCGLRPSYT